MRGRKGTSVDAVLHTTLDNIHAAREADKIMTMLFLDVLKAYDNPARLRLLRHIGCGVCTQDFEALWLLYSVSSESFVLFSKCAFLSNTYSLSPVMSSIILHNRLPQRSFNELITCTSSDVSYRVYHGGQDFTDIFAP